MANSSQEYDCTDRKVIVIQSNELFTLKQLGLQQQRERLEELRKNLPGISKTSEIADTSTPECSFHAQENVNNPRSLLKLPRYKCATQSAPTKKYKRKVSVVENGLERTKLVDFADLSRATITSTTETYEPTAEKDVGNEMVNSDSISEEKVMELIDKKYGAALEAQLNFFRDIKVGECTTTQSQVEIPPKVLQEFKVTQGPAEKLPSDIHEYKVREDQFLKEIEKEQHISEEVKEAQKHLEAIMILDSPDDGYTLFTREELKKLPEKIFESPGKPAFKEEIVPEGESLENPEKLNSNFEGDTKLLNVTNEAEVETKIVANQWENDLKDVSLILSDLKIIPSTEDPKKPHPKEHTKKITMANEDEAIFREIDEFIEEITVKDKIQLPKETTSVTNEKAATSDHDYCIENVEIDTEDSKIDEIKAEVENMEVTKEIEEESLVQCPASTNICVDAAKFEDAIKCIISNNELLEQENEEANESKTEENECNTQVEANKSDILAKLLQKSEIHFDETITGYFDSTNTPDESQSLKLDIPDKPVLVKITNDNQIRFDNFTGHFVSGEQLEATESAILVITENGFLEPVTLDTDKFNHDENKERTLCSQTKRTPEDISAGESLLNEEKRKTTQRIDRKEILAMLEKARAVRYDKNDNFHDDDRMVKQNLKHFASSLKGQVGALMKLYGRLEIDIESIKEELDRDEMVEELSDIQDDLNFIKTIIEKSFVKEERKLKYKVVSIRRKSIDQREPVSPSNKPITKKVYEKITVPRRTHRVSNKLLRRTLFRMDKLLEIMEKNQMLMKARRKPFASKSKEVTEVETKESDLLDEETNVIDNRKRETRDLSILGDGVVEESVPNDEKEDIETAYPQDNSFIQLSLKNNKEKSQDTVQSSQSLKLPTETVKVNKTNVNDGKDLQEKKSIVPSPRYPLRSQQKNNTSLMVNQARERDKDVPVGKTEGVLPYEVNYSKVLPLDKKGDHKFDYILKNDNKPCVVLYQNKTISDKPIFKKPNVCLPKKNLVVELTQENKKNKKHRVSNRYETRSKMEKPREDTHRVLRSRKI